MIRILFSSLFVFLIAGTINAQETNALMDNTIVLYNKPVKLKSTSENLIRCDVTLKTAKDEAFVQSMRNVFQSLSAASVVEADNTFSNYTFIFEKNILKGQAIDFVKKKMVEVDPQLIIATYKDSFLILKGIE